MFLLVTVLGNGGKRDSDLCYRCIVYDMCITNTRKLQIQMLCINIHVIEERNKKKKKKKNGAKRY